MGGKIKNVCIVYLEGDAKTFASQVFTDWYDFADYLKQCELKGITVTIREWHYERFRTW